MTWTVDRFVSVTHVLHGLLLIYRPRKDERLNWPHWLTRSGQLPTKWSPVQLLVRRRTDRDSLRTFSALHCATLPLRYGFMKKHYHRCIIIIIIEFNSGTIKIELDNTM